MATKRRRGAAKRTYTRQEAARKRGAAGKRFIGETAAQAARDRARERKKVSRMARAARKAKPAEAARATPSPAHGQRPSPPSPAGAPPPESGQSEAAFRAAEEIAALAGAEIEPLVPPLATVSRLSPRDAGERVEDAHEGAIAVGADTRTREEPSADVSSQHAGEGPGERTPAPMEAVTDLVRSALRLARTIASIPIRIALAVPRYALRALFQP